MSIFVIGEMASAHDGDLDKAKQLVNVAVEAGCNAVKAQFWSDSDQLADRRNVPQYYRDIYKKYQMPVEWLRLLKDYCGDRIEFMVTCFLPEDVATISPFVKRFKVSAFESEANDLLRAVFARAGKRSVIISVNQTPISESLDFLIREMDVLTDVLMYCASYYPAPLSSIDLTKIRKYSDHFLVGFSDHTGDLDMGAYAVCAGAMYIEAHMKLVNTDGLNPDGGSFAHLPEAFKQYVRNIRKAELVSSGESSISLVNQYRVVTA